MDVDHEKLTTHESLNREAAEHVGRRVAIHLEEGNWEAAHAVVDSALNEAIRRSKLDPLDELIQDAVSVRIGTILEAHNLVRVRDLAGVTRDQLLAIPAIGPKNADQVLAAYAKAIEKRAARRG